jgi:antirestriction protein ArdC
MASNDKIYDMVNDMIIERLEKGIIPWRKPWVAGADMPMNFISKKPYRGVNVFMLGIQGYTSPYWVTFKQAKSKGGQVKKGEKSTPIIFWKWMRFEDKETGEMKQVPFLRFYRVFNTEQCDGLKVPTVDLPDNFSPIDEAQAIVDGMPNAPETTHKEAKAYYAPTEDRVNMPPTENFKNPESYYCTRFHEMAHATGHKSRLNRDEVTKRTVRFGDSDYSLEELVAEMTSAMLCQKAGIGSEVIDNQAAYIQGWLKKLKNDRKLLVKAGGRAQKAFDYILGDYKEFESESE